MSEAQQRLQEALAQAKARQKSKPEPAPPSRKSASGSGRSGSSSSGAAAKSQAKKKKTPKKKSVKKKGPGIGSGLFKNIQNFATTVIDEFKTATSEISPGALLATASDSLKTIRKAVGTENEEGPSAVEDREISHRSDNAPSAHDASAQQPEAPAATGHAPSKIDPDSDEPPQYRSPAKVQRALKKKKKEDDDPDDVGKNAATSLQAVETPPETVHPSVEQAAKEGGQQESPKPQETVPQKKPAPKLQTTAVSKTEHIVRSFRALHIILNNAIWAPVITDLDSKPSVLYAPRMRFDTLFSDPIFRDGLKSAARLASTYALPPEKMRFNEKIIERVKTFPLDPQNKIKPYTENLISVLDEKTVNAILAHMQDNPVKHLLYSVGTRLGMFVPTIESLARIYLSLRKRESLSSGDRLKIQGEILLRYRKSAYTEEMGKKARNLAMNYFMDYLSEYAIKLYRERFKDVSEEQENLESQYRRHATVKTVCGNMIEEWGQKIAMSTSAINSVKSKFQESADQIIRQIAGDPSVGV